MNNDEGITRGVELTPEVIEQAMLRARKQRSEAMWTGLAWLDIRLRAGLRRLAGPWASVRRAQKRSQDLGERVPRVARADGLAGRPVAASAAVEQTRKAA